jgi:biopolymer transport protein ExbB/TolQ
MCDKGIVVKRDSTNMLKHMKTGVMTLGLLLVSPSAFAMSASECVAMNSELASSSQSLQADYAKLKKLADKAENVGDAYAAAKEESGLGDPATIKRASELRSEFETLRADVDKMNADLMTRSAGFNEKQRSFQSSCKAYIK